MLEGVVRADAFIEPQAMTACAPVTAIRKRPDAESEMTDQLLFGEGFEILDREAGFAWGQARRDGYVGFVEEGALRSEEGSATHRLCAIRAFAFAEPDINSRPLGPYCLNALIRAERREGRFVKAAGAGWFADPHLAPVGRFETDAAEVAQRFAGTPYLQGGRDGLGLDSSGLIQQALLACGRACPRDIDQQISLGRPVDPVELARGDLVFWRGHVAMMLDPARVVHADTHHMAVVIEPLAEVLARVSAAGDGEPVAYRKPSILASY